MTRVFFKFLTIFSFCTFYGNAQYLAKNHIVKNGETVYRLSKVYNVSISEIIRLNPSASKVIYIDEVLKIPVSRVNSDEPKTTFEKNPTKINDLLAYKVRPSDTKFGLSKKFGISITNLENQNQHIKKGLQAGHIIKISNSNYSSPSQSTAATNTQQSDSLQYHAVIKGDTFYSISKLYTIDLALLISVNSSIIPKKMSIGTQIRIPNQAFDAYTSLQNKTEYIVKKGDTKFGLAQIFNTTIRQLENLNPQIADMLRSGVTMQIPTKLSNVVTKNNGVQTSNENLKTQTLKDTIIEIIPPKALKDSIKEKLETKIVDPITISNETELTANIKDSSAVNTISIRENKNNEFDYKNYVIEPKETLYGLSKKAGLSIPEFLKLNPNLSESVLAGTVIKMPMAYGDSNLKSNIQNPNTDTNRDSYADLSTFITSAKNKKILMLMPFSEIEFNYYTKSTANYNAISNTDLQNNIQFYKGTKTAIDSLNNMGIKTEINILKIDDIKNKNAYENIDLNYYDAIITVQFDQEIEKAFLSKANTDIPIIALNSQFENYASSSIFQALPSVYIQKLKTLQYVNSKEGNIIMISDNERIDSRSFITKHSPTIKMVITNNKDEYSNRDIISKLDKNKTNYIIIDSKKNGVFLRSTTLLLGQTSNYDIQLVVLESSLLPINQQISTKRFRILKLIYPDINQLTNTIQTLKYFNNYKLKYGSEPSQNILQGFDITFDTVLRLSQDMGFKESAITYKTSYLTLKFSYIKNIFMIYDNNEIIIREFND
jgi:LysM repeat protein